ncbi:MAG: NUDIX domain-containing protein [Planctomycetota bacterium]|nr:NUDIX domain-containing protein [Planctomycetota bacterium]
MESSEAKRSSEVTGSSGSMPYRIACLCDLRDDRGRVLLLHRAKAPNLGMYSPIGGKLDVVSGESPAQCAQREILEEAGVEVPVERLHLVGLVSEASYEGHGHWLMFVYRVLGAVRVEAREMREGRLDWHAMETLEGLAVPESDREVIWPLIRRAEPRGAGGRPGFFAVHIDCTGGGMRWVVEQETPPS